MPIPERSADWDYEIIKQLCSIGQVETDRHDFKAGLPDPDTHTKICCAFANSGGGFVVVGVKERSGRFLPEGIQPDSEIASKFGQKIKASPTIYFEPPHNVPVPTSDRFIYVFHVPRSEYRPHLPTDPDKRIFWKRTNTGCEQMTIEEIRTEFMNYEERREKLKLLLIELVLNKEQLEEMSNTKEDTYSLVTLDASVLERLLVDTYSVIQQDNALLRILVSLRYYIRLINSKIRIFHSQMSLPMSGQNQIVSQHNSWVRKKAEFLVPLFDAGVKRLEQRFDLKNPLPPMSDAEVLKQLGLNLQQGKDHSPNSPSSAY